MIDIDERMKGSNLTRRDRIHVAYFDSLYMMYRRRERPRSLEEDFISAICESSDDALHDVIRRKGLDFVMSQIQLWLEQFGPRRQKPKSVAHGKRRVVA